MNLQEATALAEHITSAHHRLVANTHASIPFFSL
jgi:hypothetical protein